MVSRQKVNGVEIAYEDVGSGDALVLVHGSWGSHHTWDAVVPALAEDHRVITYDRRGHSDSEGTDGQGKFAEDVADLAALVEALDAVPAWVVGSSVGAVIALRLAATRPELVRGLVVHEPPLRSVMPDARKDGPIPAVLDLVRSGDHAAAARLFVEEVAFGPGAWAGLPAAVRSTMTANAPTFLDEEMAPDSRVVDETALAGYRGPVLVSSGGRSPDAFRSVARHLAGRLPQARLVEYAAAGHVPHATHPEAFVKELRAFLATAG
jgi:pimeloyl-ACP methyl ester carboxylesterase